MSYLVIKKDNATVFAQTPSKRQAKKAIHVLCHRGYHACDFAIVKIVNESKCHVVEFDSQANQFTDIIQRAEVSPDHVYMVQCDNDETWEDYRMETWQKVFRTKEAAVQAIRRVQPSYTAHPWTELKTENSHVDWVYHNYARDEKDDYKRDTWTTHCNMWIVEVPLI